MEDHNGKNAKDDIQSKLDKKLGPEYISKRVGFGTSRVAYIEGWKAINLANQIFGYDGWSTEVKSVNVDFLDERQGRFSIGCTAVVRVSLADGTFREDIGYGTVENERRKASAFERAKKSAVTDALKRSLRSFGNALGNCLYDKDFLAKIDKVKFDPPDFDEGNLFRPADELSEISRSNTMAVPDSHTEGPSLKKRLLIEGAKRSNTRNGELPDVESPVNSTTLPHRDQNSNEIESNQQQDPDDLLDDSFMFSDEIQEEDLVNMQPRRGSSKGPVSAAAATTSNDTDVSSPLTFVSAKAAVSLQNKNPIPLEAVFDPKFQAQSIKHTVDQSVSTPVRATVLKEKGIDSNKANVYSKFAPRGKELSNSTNTAMEDTSSSTADNKSAAAESETSSQQNSAQPNKSTPTRANLNQISPGTGPTNLHAPQMPQVGRPRMLQQPSTRRNISG